MKENDWTESYKVSPKKLSFTNCNSSGKVKVFLGGRTVLYGNVGLKYDSLELELHS